MSGRGSRRDFLRGRLRPSPLEEDNSSVPESPLPRVIAWLNDPPTEERRPAPLPASLPLLRPPGAVREDQFLDGCSRCDACVQACPHGAIVLAGPRFRHAAGTPMLDPAEAPCRLCEDWPCIGACPEGVLALDGAGAMGTAWIQPHDCLNALGAACSVCLEQCPVADALTLRGQTVVVNKALCTGCGICHHACPAPNNAISILPTRERPARVASERKPQPHGSHHE